MRCRHYGEWWPWLQKQIHQHANMSPVDSPPPATPNHLALYLHFCTTGIGLQVVYRAQHDVTHQENLNGSFSPVTMGREGPGGEGSAQGCSQDIAGIRMMVGLLGCRCTRRAGEVTLAMVTAIETTQPSVPANEEVTPHHCLVRQGTLGSLEGPDLLVWH